MNEEEGLRKAWKDRCKTRFKDLNPAEKEAFGKAWAAAMLLKPSKLSPEEMQHFKHAAAKIALYPPNSAMQTMKISYYAEAWFVYTSTMISDMLHPPHK